MNFINYISIIAVPMVILIILLYGILEKKNVFDLFLKGANEGINITKKIIPTLVGLFLAIGALRTSGLLDFIAKILSPILEIIRFPKEIIPLALLRPISGAGSIAIASDIMQRFGVDSFFGLIAAVIMGSTETTLYTISIYTSSVDIKKTRFVLFAAIAADLTGMLISVELCRTIFLDK